MHQLPEEREISFEMPRGSTTIIGYNPQALVRCLAGIDVQKLHFPQDRKDVSEAEQALFECLCPSLYTFECPALFVDLPLTKEAIDDLPYVILVRITEGIIEDFSLLTKSKQAIN